MRKGTTLYLLDTHGPTVTHATVRHVAGGVAYLSDNLRLKDGLLYHADGQPVRDKFAYTSEEDVTKELARRERARMIREIRRRVQEWTPENVTKETLEGILSLLGTREKVEAQSEATHIVAECKCGGKILLPISPRGVGCSGCRSFHTEASIQQLPKEYFVVKVAESTR